MAYPGVLQDYAACVRGEQPKNSPLFALGLEFDMAMSGITCGESRHDAEKTAQGTLAAIERFGYDWAMVFPDDYVEFEPLGLKMQDDPETPAMPSEYLPMDREKLGRFRIPDATSEMRLPIHLETIRSLKEKLGNTVCVVGRIAAPFSSLALVYGMNEVLTNVLLEPDLVRDNMRFFVDHQVAFGKAQFDAGADILWLGDCVASSKLIRVEHYEEFAFGPAAEVASTLSQENKHIIYHAAETAVPHLKLETQLPVSAVNIGEGVSIAGVRQELDTSMCLMGNFDPILLRDGSPDEVSLATERMVAENSRGGGYIFNTGEGITPDTPPENVLAMMEAARVGVSSRPE